MKQLELIPSQSRMTPKMIGKRKPPMPPASPTMPVTTPIFSGKSSPTYLKVEAMPQAKERPKPKSSTVKTSEESPIWNCDGPRIVCTTKSICGSESRKRQIQAAQSTHQVSRCAPKRSASQPPSARSTPAGSEKHAAKSAALAMLKPYSWTKYCGIHTESAVKPPNTIE